jgi:hypothetical protein
MLANVGRAYKDGRLIPIEAVARKRWQLQGRDEIVVDINAPAGTALESPRACYGDISESPLDQW